MLNQEQLFTFLKEGFTEADDGKLDEVRRFFDALNSARTVGDLRKIVSEFPLETALECADVFTVYRQWLRLMEKSSGAYAEEVFKKLLAAAAARSQKRRCLL